MPGYYDASPPDPDPHPCEKCEYYDLVEGCTEGHEPESCPELCHMDKSEWDDREYHRGVDEGVEVK